MDPTNNELSATSDTTRTMNLIMRALRRMSPASHHRRKVQIVDDRPAAPDIAAVRLFANSSPP